MMACVRYIVTLALVHLIPSWADINCMVHVVLPKQPINQFKPVHQSNQLALRAYYPNKYTVVKRKVW